MIPYMELFFSMTNTPRKDCLLWYCTTWIYLNLNRRNISMNFGNILNSINNSYNVSELIKERHYSFVNNEYRFLCYTCLDHFVSVLCFLSPCHRSEHHSLQNFRQFDFVLFWISDWECFESIFHLGIRI